MGVAQALGALRLGSLRSSVLAAFVAAPPPAIRPLPSAPARRLGDLLRVVRAPRIRTVALALLALATVVRLTLLARGWPALDSDEAVTGLMARHIAFAHEYPVFFWGEHYMGNLQAYVAAGLFTVFGSSTIVLHLTVLLFTLGFLAAMFALGRAAYGEVVGVLTLGWLAVGPSFALLREAMAACGYQDVLLFGALLLLGVYWRLRQPRALPTDRRAWLRCLATYALIGLCIGVGMWSDLLMVPVALVSLIALAVMRWRELLHLGGVVLLATILLGNAPALAYNLTHSFEQYTEAAQLSQGGVPGAPATSAAAGVGETLTVALPTIFGSPHVCVNRGLIPISYPAPLAQETASGGACDMGNLLFSLGLLTVYALVAWQGALMAYSWLRWRWRFVARRRALARRWSAGAGAPSAARPPTLAPQTRARYWLRGMLVAIAALYIALYFRSPDAIRFQLTSARYLLPLYLTVPVLFGVLWAYGSPWLARLTRVLHRGRMPHRSRASRTLATPRAVGGRVGRRVAGARAPVAAGALLALLALSLYGGAATQARAADSALFAQPATPADAAIIAFLHAHNIRVYYSDYWECYPLAFETNEQITCAVRGLRGETGLQLATNRYDPYVSRLKTEPYPAYLFTAGSTQDARFYNEATKLALPHTGYVRAQVGACAIYYYPGASPPARDTMRAQARALAVGYTAP